MNLIAMNLIAMTELCRVAENIPMDRLDMDVWDCGTQACLCGWAARDSWFQEQGLRFNPELETIMFNTLAGYEALQCLFGLRRNDIDRLFNPETYADTQGRFRRPTRNDILARIDSVIHENR